MATQRWEERATDLFNMLVEGDQTYETVCDALDWDRQWFYKAVQTLRDELAGGDSISVVCEPQGKGEPWLYSLRAGNVVIDAEDDFWLNNRFGDTERRILTIRHVIDTAVRATTGRTVLGKKARIYQLHLKRAEEEVAMLMDGQI